MKETNLQSLGQEAIVKSFLLMKKGRDKGDGPFCRALFL